MTRSAGDVTGPLAGRQGQLRRVWASRRPWLVAIVFGVLMFICSLVLDLVFLYTHESTGLTVSVSDALAGVVAGLLVWRLMALQADRQRRTDERLRIISDMNHHVRNALQVISYSVKTSRGQQELDEITASVDRIQWALREVLPKVEPTFKPAALNSTEHPSSGGNSDRTK